MILSPAGADTARPPQHRSTRPLPVVPCTCRYAGQNFQLGQIACIRGRAARCDRVLNNTSWTIGDAPCPVSALDMTPRRLQE